MRNNEVALARARTGWLWKPLAGADERNLIAPCIVVSAHLVARVGEDVEAPAIIPERPADIEFAHRNIGDHRGRRGQEKAERVRVTLK
jgi:hypothetical protein